MNVLRRTHLPACAHELAVFDPASSTYMSLDLHIVGPVQNCHLCLRLREQTSEILSLARITHYNPMVTQHKAVASAGDCWPRACLDHVVGRVLRIGAEVAKKGVDFER